ncbi:hypothetical protein NHX12_016470 [Muraenolepis orangiensis]|uniref:Fibronectin type-III domain-containing protein n=1 Tax=Muraenolepis orangiensis TaxID=630683 RepID=A0A9Q0D7W3_9TELE|nr:hypothetical protein NHX12_016470 [Muraenolepis orangiensis]
MSAVSQRLATVPFLKPDSHGGVPTSRYLVQSTRSSPPTVVLMSLEPNTTYEGRVAAVNKQRLRDTAHKTTGDMPIVEYIVKYKMDKEEQWMTKLVSGAYHLVLLQPLHWNTWYEVEITARNVKGLSEPTFYQFFMPQKPDITVLERCQMEHLHEGTPVPASLMTVFVSSSALTPASARNQYGRFAFGSPVINAEAHTDLIKGESITAS